MQRVAGAITILTLACAGAALADDDAGHNPSVECAADLDALTGVTSTDEVGTRLARWAQQRLNDAETLSRAMTSLTSASTDRESVRHTVHAIAIAQQIVRDDEMLGRARAHGCTWATNVDSSRLTWFGVSRPR